jgi:hypothetical protein
VRAASHADLQARSSNASWVLGWQFTAGEHLQQQRDVFGDDGITNVFLTAPDQAAAGAPQGIAVFSEWHILRVQLLVVAGIAVCGMQKLWTVLARDNAWNCWFMYVV